MSDSKPRGILRNRDEVQNSEVDVVGDRLDRQEVIRNTRLNSHLVSDSSKGDEIRAQIAEEKKKKIANGDGEKLPDHLKWDELNLYKTEQEKCATMKIDEPKTPYEGGFNPEGEYYKDDDESTIPGFSLGSGTFEEGIVNNDESLNGGEIIKDPDYKEPEQPQEDEKEHPMSAEEKHKAFEEKRKAHYHLKGNALKHNIPPSDEENDAA